PNRARGGGCRSMPPAPRPSHQVFGGAVQIGPVFAFADDGFEVLLPCRQVPVVVANHGAHQGTGEIFSADVAVAEMGGEAGGAAQRVDGLGGAQAAAGTFHADSPVVGDAAAQLAKNGDEAPYLGGGEAAVVEAPALHGAADAPGDDAHLGVEVFGERQDDGVEAPAQGRRQLVDAAVAGVGRGDEVEAADGLNLAAQLGDGEGFLAEGRDE